MKGLENDSTFRTVKPTQLKNKSRASTATGVSVVETCLSDDISDWDTPYEYDGSVYDGAYGEDLEEEKIVLNSSWSVHHNPGSSDTCNNDGGSDSEKEAQLSSRYVLEGATSFEEQNLYVRVAKKSVFIRDDGETIYGSLFEDPDPWRRIGIILGLEKDDDDEVQCAPEADKRYEGQSSNVQVSSQRSTRQAKTTIHLTGILLQIRTRLHHKSIQKLTNQKPKKVAQMSWPFLNYKKSMESIWLLRY